MKIIITKASDLGFEQEAEWHSLEDLVAFLADQMSDAIVSRTDDGISVMIYDDYVE